MNMKTVVIDGVEFELVESTMTNPALDIVNGLVEEEKRVKEVERLYDDIKDISRVITLLNKQRNKMLDDVKELRGTENANT